MRPEIALVLSLAIASAACGEPSVDDDTALAAVSGKVLYSGRVFRPGAAGLTNEDGRFRIDAPSARGLEFVFVYLEDVRDLGREVPATTHEAAKMDQISFRFRPRVLGVRRGQAVLFGNGDGTNHNVRAISTEPRNAFNIIIVPDGEYEKRFQLQPANAPIRLACDFHPAMEAWIYIVDHPYFAVTGDDGRFTIEKVPPGVYRLHMRDPQDQFHAEAEITLAPGERLHAETTFGIPHRYNRAEPPIDVAPGGIEPDVSAEVSE